MIQRFACLLGAVILAVNAAAENLPSFLAPVVNTNGEVTLRLLGRSGVNYRLETSTNGLVWRPLATLSGAASSTHVDSAAPFLSQRFYRAAQVETNLMAGDHIATSEGDVIVRPVNHASFVLGWNGRLIYNDPVGGAARFRDFPKADLILVSHSHGDHYDAATLNGVLGPEGLIVVPPSIYSGLAATLRSKAVSLANGASTNLLGLSVEAVPAYNANHARGSGNGYVLTIGGTRFYMSGDTGDTAEMRALPEIDVAFLCMNIPFTMNVTSAASAARDFKPRILYPYHYRNQDGSFADLNTLKRLIGTNDQVEVRTRAWY